MSQKCKANDQIKCNTYKGGSTKHQSVAILAQGPFGSRRMSSRPRQASGATASKALSCRIRLDKQRQRSYASYMHEGTGLSNWTVATALCIVCLSGYNFCLATDWLERKKRRGTLLHEDCSVPAMREALEDHFLSLDPDDIAGLLFGKGRTRDESACLLAEKYINEVRLAAWVRKRNVDGGAVVRTEVLINEFNKYMAESGGQFKPRVTGPTFPLRSRWSPQGRKWAERWRSKFKGKYGSLHVEEPCTLEEKRTKAPLKK